MRTLESQIWMKCIVRIVFFHAYKIIFTTVNWNLFMDQTIQVKTFSVGFTSNTVPCKHLINHMYIPHILDWGLFITIYIFIYINYVCIYIYISYSFNVKNQSCYDLFGRNSRCFSNLLYFWLHELVIPGYTLCL